MREAVRKHWLKILLEDIANKSTLVNLQKDHLQFGSTHQVWDSLQSTVSHVKKGIIKVLLLTGTYMLQAMKSKYSTGKESAMCKCCGIENEDITHFLLSCPALFQKRKLYYSQLKESVINMIVIDKWNIQFSSKLDIVKLIIDCTFLAPLLKNDGDLEHLHKLSSELCYCLHTQRIWMLSKQETG